MIRFSGVIILCMLAAAHALYIQIPEGRQYTEKPWMGQWISTNHSENIPQLAQVLGMPELFVENSDARSVQNTFFKAKGFYHHIVSIVTGSASDTKVHKDNEFEFNRAIEFPYGNDTARLIYRESGPNLVIDVNALSRNKHFTTSYEVDADQLVKVFRVGNLVAKRWFKKLTGRSTETIKREVFCVDIKSCPWPQNPFW